MRPYIIPGLILIALTVAIHAVGTLGFLRMLVRYRPMWERRAGVLINTLTLSWVVTTLVALHTAEIAAWAAFYHLRGLFPDFETSLYYSLCSYTTVGFGDVVLPKAWRLLGTIEALVGILMTSWSVALLIGVVTTINQADMSQANRKPGEVEPESR